jgi:hypothetical protein
MRFLGWGFLWLLFFGSVDIDAKYTDGVRIRFRNIWRRR